MPEGPHGGRGGISWRAALIGALLLVVASSASTYVITNLDYTDLLRGLPADPAKQATVVEMQGSPAFDRLVTVLTLIRQEFVEETDMDTLLEGAAAGAVSALEDRYSVFFDASQFRDFSIDTSGTYGGIGVQVTERDGRVVIMTPFPGTPGDTTPFQGARPEDPRGLKPDDIILKVDGRSIERLTVEKVAELIRGEPGTTVELVVLRPGTPEGPRQLTFSITRQRIEVPTVESKMLNRQEGIAYLRLSMFNEHTTAQVEEALEVLQGQGMQALVLDLRNNPGGLLDEVVKVAGNFVPRGPVVIVEDRGGRRTVHRSDNPRGFGKPLVVLVNGATASAAEILSGAIQDTGVGTVVGTRTFGKGVVQRVWNLGDGTGLKLTTSRYLTPKGRDINERVDPDTGEEVGGILPDVEVEQPEGAVFGSPSQDPQLQKAVEILRQEMGL